MYNTYLQSYRFAIQTMIFMWKYGMVDGLTAVQFFYNAGVQYTAMVAAAIAEGDVTTWSHLRQLPRMLVEPFAGFGVSVRFIKAAQTAAERQARVSTLAAFLASSGAAATSSTPSTNAAIAAGIACHIAHMRETLATRGGSSTSNVLSSGIENFKIILTPAKTPFWEINSYDLQFVENSKLIINGIFKEHNARRYFRSSASNLKILTPTSLTPIVSTPIVSTQIKLSSLIGWTCVGLGVVSFTVLGSLYLFQRSKRICWENKQHQNDEVVIDVVACSYIE